MPNRKVVHLSAVVFLCCFFSGCAAKGIQVRGYVEDKERVDQELAGGNAGYLHGTPIGNNAPRKETRKIYVLEMTKESDPVAEDGEVSPSNIKKETTVLRENVSRTQRLETTLTEPHLPVFSFDDEPISVDGTPQPDPFVERKKKPSPETYAVYTIEKDDTLQNISKKFYDSFSKWTKIYEANRLKIKDPNRLVPGTVLKIPVE